MTTKRNEPCPCGSGLRFKKCCAVKGGVVSGDADFHARPERADEAKPDQVQAAVRTTADLQTSPDKLRIAQEYYGRGVAMVNQSRLPEAIDCFTEALALQPAAEVYFNLGMLQARAGRPTDAIDSFNQALLLKPNLKIAYLHLGDLFLGGNDFYKAIECYREYLSVDKNNAEIYNNLGIALKNANMFEEAAENFKRAICLDKNYAEAYVNLGIVFIDQSKLEDAIDSFRKALSINHLLHKAYEEISRVYYKQGKYDESAEYLIKSLSLYPGCSERLIRLGAIYKKQRKYEQASDCFNKVLAIDPDKYEAINNLGVVNLDQGRYEEAAEYFRKTLAKKSRLAQPLYGLGVILNAQGKTKEAVSCFIEALDCEPDFPLAQIYLAIIYWISGDFDACQYHLGQICDYNKESIKSDNGFIVSYHRYISELIKYRESNAIIYKKSNVLPSIYFVGDSHCLTTANTMVCFNGMNYIVKSELVIGCKAWHLGNRNFNKYKYEFEKVLDGIPGGSVSIFMFGEIDCRIGEGIIKNYKKNNTDLAESVNELVGGYFNYLLSALSIRSIFPIICNIPARGIEQENSSPSDQVLQKEVIRIFNQELKYHAERKQIKLLDTYSLSRKLMTSPENECHIDGTHLLPSVFAHLINEL